MNESPRALLFAIVLAVLSGCGEGTKTPTVASPGEQVAPDRSESSTLADLAQRDVDAFLNRRREAEEQPVESHAQVRSAPRQIVWNQNPDPSPPPAAPMGIDEPEVQQSPLFLIADDIEEKPPPQAEQPSLDRDRVRELIVDLSKELYRDAAHADMPLRELFLVAATSLVSPDRALNADAIPGLTGRERDLLREFQQFFVQLGESLDGSRDAEEIILNSIEQLRQSLRTDPQLMLGSVALCTRVNGFGDFEPFNKYAFLAHSEQQAVVYIEIAGFTSELNQRDEWVTELSQHLTIYSDRDGIPVWREEWQTAVDRTRNKRTDFFVVQLVTLPNALSVGRYHLKVRVRDEKSKAEAEATIPFEMVADPKMAATVR